MTSHKIPQTLVAGLGKLPSLSDQIKAQALHVGGGWETIADDLARTAAEDFGNEPCKTAREFLAVCNEVFRSER